MCSFKCMIDVHFVYNHMLTLKICLHCKFVYNTREHWCEALYRQTWVWWKTNACVHISPWSHYFALYMKFAFVVKKTCSIANIDVTSSTSTINEPVIFSFSVTFPELKGYGRMYIIRTAIRTQKEISSNMIKDCFGRLMINWLTPESAKNSVSFVS